MDNLLSRGHRRKETAPSTITVDITDLTSPLDRPTEGTVGEGWLDTSGGQSDHIWSTANNFGTQAWLNADPAAEPTFAVTGTGIDLLLPGVYEGLITVELSAINDTIEYGLGVVSDGASPTVFYKDDGLNDTSRIMLTNERRSVTRSFLVDISVPTTIQAVLVERASSGSGLLRTDGGQITLTRIANYTGVTRT